MWTGDLVEDIKLFVKRTAAMWPNGCAEHFSALFLMLKPRLGHIWASQEHLGAPIYWSRAPIYWSPKILFSTFWKGMKRKSYDKTRFCVSHEGLSNGLGTFGLTWYMFENKTKNMFLIWRGSNVLEPRLQYNGARAPIYWSHQFFFPIRQ